MTEDKVSPILLLEKVTILDGKVTAAHGRVDNIERMLNEQLREISKELKDVVGWMNRGKGWAAASLILSSAAGGVIATVLTLLFKGH